MTSRSTSNRTLLLRGKAAALWVHLTLALPLRGFPFSFPLHQLPFHFTAFTSPLRTLDREGFKLGKIMTQSPPNDVATACPTPRSPGDPDSWGYTIFRTDYDPGSDEAFTKAVERLVVYAKRWAQVNKYEPEPNQIGRHHPHEELWGRYYSEVIQDEQTLANATASQVGERFDTWIRQQHRPAVSNGPPTDSRFLFCLMLDEDSIDNILALSEDPRRQRPFPADEDDGWVKVVTNQTRSEGEGGGRWWLRVGIVDYLWPMWFFSAFDSDAMLEELGWIDPEDGVQNLWGSHEGWWKHIEEAYRSRSLSENPEVQL